MWLSFSDKLIDINLFSNHHYLITFSNIIIYLSSLPNYTTAITTVILMLDLSAFLTGMFVYVKMSVIII